MGRPQEMAFLQAPGGWFRAYTWAGHAHSGTPPQASLGSRDPPFSCQTIFTGSLGTCVGKQKPTLPPRGPCDFP